MVPSGLAQLNPSKGAGRRRATSAMSLGRTDLRSDLLGLGRRPFWRQEELQNTSDLGTHPLRRHGLALQGLHQSCASGHTSPPARAGGVERPRGVAACCPHPAGCRALRALGRPCCFVAGCPLPLGKVLRKTMRSRFWKAGGFQPGSESQLKSKWNQYHSDGKFPLAACFRLAR